MTITPYGWGALAFAFFSLWLCRKILRRYGHSPGCLGRVWLFLVVFIIGSFVVVFLPLAVSYAFFRPELNLPMLAGISFMLTILVTAYYGILKYAFNGNMLSWVINVRKFGLLFFVPMLMLSFDLLLVYALLYGNNVDVLWVKLLLGFFIFALTMAIPGYIKGMLEDYSAGAFEPSDEALEKERQRQMNKGKRR